MADTTAGTSETPAPVESNGDAEGARREKRQHTPSEELYDLTKPIPPEQKPDKAKHDADIEAFGNKINDLKDKKQAVQSKIDAALDGGKNAEVAKERELLKGLFQKKGEQIREIRTLRNRLDIVRKQADNLFTEQKNARSKIRFSNVATIDEEIKKLKKRQETTSMSLSEEKRLIKEMEAMETSKKYLADVVSSETSIGDVKDQRAALQDLIATKNKEIDAVQEEITKKQAHMDSMKDTENESRQNLTALKEERNALSKEIGEVMDERNTTRNEFRTANNKWYDYQRAVKAQRKLQYDERLQKEKEEEEAYQKTLEEEEAKKVPYEEEKSLCDYLINYLTKTYLENDKKSEEKVAEVKKLDNDPFAGFKPVNKKVDDMFLQIGKPVKKPRFRHSKKNAVPQFKLSVHEFEQFGFLNLSPPTKLEDVTKSVEELKAKKEWYKEQPRGSVPTVKEIRKANEEAARTARTKKPTKKNGKKLDIFGDDFAPLSAATSTNAPVNAMWGQKPAEEVSEVAPAFDMGDAPALSPEPSD